MKHHLIVGLLMMGAAFADVVTEWNVIMRTTMSAEGSQTQARFAAITHLAMFEAVNAITAEYEPYLRNIPPAAGASADAAVVAAAHNVLKNYFPGAATALDASRTRSLAAITDGAAKTAGIAVGERVAAALIAQRNNDGASPAIAYTPPVGLGYWEPTLPGFAAGTFLHWARVAPFGIARPDQFRPKPPPRLGSRRYTRDYNEVKSVGGVGSGARPDDRADIATLASRTSPVVVWNDVAVQLAEANQATLAENARTFALLNIAMADASIAVFEAKYFYHFWRPVTAIRAGESDGNPDTEPDPSFTPFITTPAYPSYPSGQGALSNAGRYILEDIYGRGRHHIALSNPALPGIRFEYTKLRQITDDIADARVYSGIHFRFEQDEAESLGERIGRYVLTHNLRPVRVRD